MARMFRVTLCAMLMVGLPACLPERIELTSPTYSSGRIVVALPAFLSEPADAPLSSAVRSQTSPGAAQIRTVGIVPFDAGAAPDRVALELAEVFAAQLQHLGQIRMMVLRDDAGRLIPPPGLEEGSPPTVQGLIRARRELGVDAVVYGRVTQYQPYGPPVLGLDVRMVSCKTGDTLWVASGVFDSSRPDVFGRFEEYCRTQVADGSAAATGKVALKSPRHYAQFASYEIASTLVTE